MSEVPEERDDAEGEEDRSRAEEAHRSDGVRRAQTERTASLRRQRFGKDEQSVEEVREGQHRREPERRAEVDRTEQTADGRSDDEADAERDTEHAEPRGALLRWRDVRDVRTGDAEGRRRRAGDEPADEEDGDRRRDRHDDVIDPEAEVREQDHRTAAVAIGERALHRREDDLHDGEGRAKDPEDRGRAGHVAALQPEDELREHRDDHPERHHVEQDGDEDEDERRARSGHHA